MAVTYQWKWIRGAKQTHYFDNAATALGKTYTPVKVASNVLAVPTDACAVWGVAIPSAAASAKKVPVIVSNDIFEVQATGDLGLGASVMVNADGGVSALSGTAALECGVVVDYNPASDGIAHIQAKFVPQNTQATGT